MTELDAVAERFETHRARLRGVAFRMLGSVTEADDAVQETWLRLARTGPGTVQNLGGWLTTVVSRVCLDMLRARASRREDLVGQHPPEDHPAAGPDGDPAAESELVDDVGRALLVVLDRLAPAERVAFVLHDMFAVPFDEIAPIVDRSPAAARQLASRARRRVQQTDAVPEGETARRKEIVGAFLAASRGGDFEALLAMLDPDIVLRADAVSAQVNVGSEVRGTAAVAAIFSGRAAGARPALIDGAPGMMWAQGGTIRVVFDFTIVGDRIAAIEMIADPEVLALIDIVPATRAEFGGL
jgi:RNA polymerase sigma factor (sigma-70 family)